MWTWTDAGDVHGLRAADVAAAVALGAAAVDYDTVGEGEVEFDV